MVEEQAQVLRIDQNQALIEIHHQSSCGSCSQQSSCGTSSLSQLFGKRPTQFEVEVPINTLVQGDLIVIGLDDLAYLKASMYIYFIPLLSMFAVAVLASGLFELSDFGVTIAAVFGLLAGFKWANILSCKFKSQLSPQFVKKV